MYTYKQENGKWLVMRGEEVVAERDTAADAEEEAARRNRQQDAADAMMGF